MSFCLLTKWLRVLILLLSLKHDKINKNTRKTNQNDTHFKTGWHEQQSITRAHKIEKTNANYIENWKWLDNLSALVSIDLTRNLVFINNEVRKYGHNPIKYNQKKLYSKHVSATFYQFLIFSPNDSPLKTMKNVFYLM